MKSILYTFLFVFFVNCNPTPKTSTTLAQNSTAMVKSTSENTVNFNTTFLHEYPKNKDPYTLGIRIQQVGKNTYALEIDMQLQQGAFFVSPNSKRDFKGKFSVKLSENDKINATNTLQEIPLSKEEFDAHPYVNGYVNWVKQNTTYRQQIKINPKEDFKIPGVIRFVIEPRCTLEEIGFILIYENGELKVRRDLC
ncbi:hypothetical protein [Tenacibaculum agarivorans]|uniref:hypothetical protein n=1 Tax=Tenacibaculum agarivorans TaxID=1908389 RepID=UPI00094B8A06|nr:hypothetical protein [Tenacibaculum agarivorans]